MPIFHSNIAGITLLTHKTTHGCFVAVPQGVDCLKLSSHRSCHHSPQEQHFDISCTVTSDLDGQRRFNQSSAVSQSSPVSARAFSKSHSRSTTFLSSTMQMRAFLARNIITKQERETNHSPQVCQVSMTKVYMRQGSNLEIKTEQSSK
jgi:hypothetical protein